MRLCLSLGPTLCIDAVSEQQQQLVILALFEFSDHIRDRVGNKCRLGTQGREPELQSGRAIVDDE